MKLFFQSFFIAICIMNFSTMAQTKRDSLEYNNNNPGGNKSFFIIGSTIGTPGGISLNTGFFGKYFYLKVSGGYWKKDWYGYQVDAGYFFSRTSKLLQGISLVTGGFDVINLDNSGNSRTFLQQNYIGAAYDAYYAGFFLQAGLGFGLHPYPPNPQLLFQVGYLFKL